jgi:hypothetical protein
MFPALRQNGLARWMGIVLALFGLAAGLALALALSISALRGGAARRQEGTREAPSAMHARLDRAPAPAGNVGVR